MYSVLVYLRYKLKVSNVRFDKILYHQWNIQVKTDNSRLLQGWSSIKHKTKNNTNINPVLFTKKLSFGKKNGRGEKTNFKTLKTPRVGQIHQNFIILIINTIPFHF